MSLRAKTIVGTAIIEATLLIILIVTTLSFLSQLIDDTLIKRAATTSSLFASTTKNAMLSHDLASLETSVEELMHNDDIVYVKVLDQNGMIYAQAGPKDTLNKTFIADTSIQSVNDDIYDATAPITVGKTEYGRIELGIDIASIQISIAKIRNWLSTIAAIEMILVGLFSFVLGSYLTARLKQLRHKTNRIAAAVQTNDYSGVVVDVKGNDELTELAKTFNTLVSNLSKENEYRVQAEQELRELNQSLEQKVAKRTALLSDKNTELESANNSLKEAQQQLLQAEKMASVGQLAAGVAHEINNPIGFVSSNISTLSDYIALYQIIISQVEKLNQTEDPQIQASVRSELIDIYQQHDIAFINEDITPLIEESAEGLHRVSEIVKGLKLFSRVDSDEKQWFDINNCIRTTLSMVNNKLKYISTVELKLSDVPQLYLNVGKLTQVFTNLLINAGQAIETTGKQGLITITSKLVDENVVVTIEDNGCGVAQEHLDKLFNPFFTTKPEGQGTGLGLSISYGILQEHDGNLEATSEEGKGSCFTLTIPVKQEDASPW